MHDVDGDYGENSGLVAAGIVGGVIFLCLVFLILALVCKAANAKRNRTRHHVNTQSITVVSQQHQHPYGGHYRHRAAGGQRPMIPAQPPQPPPYTVGAPPGDRVFSPPPAYPGTPAPPSTNIPRANTTNKSRGAFRTPIGDASNPTSPPPAYYE